ncbi:MAG TPA: hypothetical protein VF447_14840 [Terriglobales bacterium]
MVSGEPTNFWRDEDVALLKKLVNDNTPNADIAERLGRSVLSVKAKIARLAMPKRLAVRTSWTDEASKQLLKLRDEMGLGWTEIGKRLDRAGSSCHTRYYLLKNPSTPHKVFQREPLDEGAYKDRSRRLSISHASLTAAFFGDPLPGYSALDKRHA